MFERKKLNQLSDFFLPYKDRKEKGVYFYRINNFNEKIENFLRKFYDIARRFGVIIEGRIPNPTENNLAYFEEAMGYRFQMSLGFLSDSLKKWLPRMSQEQRNAIASAMYDTLDGLRKTGKNENMLKNAYIKFMCWLYYKFERILNYLGADDLPKILYEGEVSQYELLLLSVLSKSGCDILLLQYKGDAPYQRLDPNSCYSDAFLMENGAPFPEYFHLKWLQEKIREEMEQERLYGIKPALQNCTNAWIDGIEGKGFNDIKKDFKERGSDLNLFYNCFCRINGVEDTLSYMSGLYQFQLELTRAKRKLLIIEHEIAPPTPEEIQKISRKNYTKIDQMIADLAANLRQISDMQLQRLAHKAFVDLLLEESRIDGMNQNKLTNKGVFLLCWLKRYQSALFSGWKAPEISCFIFLGGCRNENEALFVRFLARLPVDVLILRPDLEKSCKLSDPMLYEVQEPYSMQVAHFPTEDKGLQLGTAAYHAERELDRILYQDSGMYRIQQYGKASSLSLQTTYEEIGILWDQELKYRPNFSVMDGVVNMPVLLAKVSGVKDGLQPQYWAGIKTLITPDTIVIKTLPFVDPTDKSPMMAHAAEFFKNGKLNKAKIKSHPAYPYGFLREEMQDYILEKLQLLISQKIIKGTFENGTEYTVIGTVLHLKKEITRMLQKFDFTKKNPKLIFILATEAILSLEDSILTAFLNLAGFDIVFFVPTGYQNIEKYFNKRIIEEHQAGEYLYDMNVPDFAKISSNARLSWRDKIFKRGR